MENLKKYIDKLEAKIKEVKEKNKDFIYDFCFYQQHEDEDIVNLIEALLFTRLDPDKKNVK